MDWTDNYSRKKISDYSNVLVEELIREIHSEKLTIHTEYSLTINELGILYRWPFYLGVNTFFERLVRTLDNKKIKGVSHYIVEADSPEYYINIAISASHYYNDISLNNKLLNDMSAIIFGGNVMDEHSVSLLNSDIEPNISLLNKRQYTFKSGKRFTKRTIISFYLSCLRKFTKPDVIYEDMKWLNLIFPVRNRFQELKYKKYQADYQIRNRLKQIFFKVYVSNQKGNPLKLDNSTNDNIAKLFTEWIDQVLPLSLIEGLSDRLKYYQNMLYEWDIKQVHSAIGYSYNDNLKCFSILAKRKNAKLIGHDHGVNNFAKIIPLKPEGEFKYKWSILIHFFDYYLTWGASTHDSGNAWGNVDKIDTIKIKNNGSVYLSELKKWGKQNVDQQNIRLLYVSGPLRTFAANLEEITPERNVFNRKKVLMMLKNILDQHKNLTILYKQFTGIDLSNDPITQILPKYIDQGRVQITSESPVKLMPNIDIAFFDMISTGFAEAVQIGVPTLVYSNDYDYNLASQEGKKINDELKLCGIVFYHAEAGIKSFEKIITDLSDFQKSSSEPIRHFQEGVAFPVSKKSFLKNMDTKITSANSEV